MADVNVFLLPYYKINILPDKYFKRVFTARCYASAVLVMGLCLCLSQVGVLLKRLKNRDQLGEPYGTLGNRVWATFTFFTRPVVPRLSGLVAFLVLMIGVKFGCDRSRDFAVATDFHRAMLCIRGTSHGPVSVRLYVCHKSKFY